MNHEWIYRDFVDIKGEAAHSWRCSRCDSLAVNYMDDGVPKSSGLVLARDRKTYLTCEQKMVENIQVG